jgi:alkanesulfonate monooxygenase SsuD/methylene tetrahydromethanopterin reductase-like flavin-dependent oxidoreductase (luciferase family)
MRFGLFGSPRAGRAGPDAGSAQGYRDFLASAVEAEALGFRSCFLVEHHFTGMGQPSATLHLLQAMAALTQRLRIGTAVTVLPWHNPVLLAEQAATVDQLSGGRLDLGIGKGYRHNEFSGFCMPPEEAEPRFTEALAVLRLAWTSESRFSHHGRFWRFENILVDPPPAQRPHPPLWMGAGSPDSIRQAAAHGCNLLLDQFASPAQIGGRIALFRQEVEARGRGFDPASVAVARNLHVAATEAEAAAARARQAESHRAMIALSQSPDGSGRSHVLAYPETATIALENALYGTPEQILAGLAELQSVGVEYVLLHAGRAPLDSLRRFAREVMPLLAAPPPQPPQSLGK